MATAEVVYAEQLFRRGKGYPLWEPEPRDSGEVTIGDVGYIHRGAFYRMFNASRDPQDELNQTLGVPDEFEKFAIGTLVPQRSAGAIGAGPLASKTLKRIELKADASVHGIGASCEFECTDDQAAILVLKAPADREELHQTRRMKNYMFKHIQNWHTFATDQLGLELEQDEILFVRGWVKTASWEVTAFTHQGRSGKVHFNGNLGSAVPASASFSLKVIHQNSAAYEHRAGPDHRHSAHVEQTSTGKRRGRNRNEQHPAPLESPLNQCVFLHYFKLRRRLFFGKKIEAAAEPRDPSTTSDDDDDPIEQVPPNQKPYDPVSHILDYILEHSGAEAALASDMDLVELCEGGEEDEFPIPDDIPAFLERIQPHIEVTEDGLGMISTENIGLVTQGGGVTADIPATGDTAVNPPPASGVDEDIDMNDDKGPKRFDISDSLLQLGDDEHRGGICTLAYAPNGLYVAGGFEDSSIVIWNPLNRQRIHVLRGHMDAVCSLAFRANSTELVSGSRDSRLIVWGVANGEQRAVLNGHTGFVNAVTYSPDGNMIVSASVDFSIRLWNADTGASMGELGQHEAMVMFVAFSPDAKRLVSASADCVARLWNMEDRTLIADLDAHEGVIYSISFSHDSRRLVTSSDDGTVRIWSAISGDEFVILREHTGSVWAAAFSPDGKQVLSVGSERMVKICDSYSGDLLKTIDGGDGLVNAAAFSPNATLVAAGAEDHTVRVWNTETGAHVANFSGHNDNVNRLRFSPDGRRIISSSDDSTVRLWNMDDAFPVNVVL